MQKNGSWRKSRHRNSDCPGALFTGSQSVCLIKHYADTHLHHSGHNPSLGTLQFPLHAGKNDVRL